MQKVHVEVSDCLPFELNMKTAGVLKLAQHGTFHCASQSQGQEFLE